MQILVTSKIVVCSNRAPRRCAARGIPLLLVGCALVPGAFAQFRASIQGAVTDTTGAVIQGATVTLTDLGTNKVLNSTTNAAGVFNFNALPPDRFSLTAEKSGFQKQVLNDVQLIPEQANSINVQLSAGAASQTVTVSASDAPALDTETANVSGTVGSNEIQHLPSFGRDIFQLAQLAPGISGDSAQASGGGTYNRPGNQGPGGSSNNSSIFATENGPQIQSSGGQYESNSISIDGISTVSAVWGGTSVITPSEDSVSNMKIVSNSYDAENGRFSGAQIQVTTKSGTNAVHGSLFFKRDSAGLNAYQRWNGPSSEFSGTPRARGLNKNTQQFNNYGGSVGGPLWKDKIFAFFSYETVRQKSSTSQQNWYETPDFHSQAPAGSIAATLLTFPGTGPASNALISKTCVDLALVEGVDCATIPGKGLDIGSPLKSPLGTQDPTYVSSKQPGVGSGLDGVADVGFFNTLNPTTVTEAQYNGRLDADVTHRDRLSFTIYWVPNTQTSYNGPIRPANLWHHEVINNAFAGIWNHTFTPNLLNEARANAAGWRWNELSTNGQAAFGLPQENFDDLGSASSTSNTSTAALQYLGAPGPSVLNQWTYSYRDIVTKIQGRHSLKFGGELTRLEYLNANYGGARPQYNFRNIWNFANDAPYKETGTFDPLTGLVSVHRLDERENLWGFFAQDDIKVLPNLTINLGLRWSYFQAMYSKQNNLGVALLGTGANTFTGLRVRTGGHLYDPQKTNLGPQFGFAWIPGASGKMVLRGGFGINYNQNEIAITANGGGNPPGVVNPTLFAGQGLLYGIASTPKSFYGYPSNPNTVSAFGPNGLPVTGTLGITGFPSSPKSIMTYHFSLDTQYDLGHQLVASVGYSSTLGRHLLTQNQHNIFGIINGTPLNPQVNNFDWYDNSGSSNYHAFLAGLKHNFSHSFMADAEYTWAKSMDTNSGPYTEDPYPYDISLAYGRSDYNIGQAFKLYGLWQPVIFRGSRSWLEKVAGGWSVSGIFNLHSGFPWTPVYSVPGGNLYYKGSGYGSLRPAAYLGGAHHDTSNSAFKSGPGGTRPAAHNKNFPNGPTAYYTIPTARDGTPLTSTLPAFPTPVDIPQGPGVSRNSLNGPGYNDVDGTLSKAFGLPTLPVLGESAKFEIRADVFNVFNKENLNAGSISNQITSDNFGQAQSALGSRTVEVQARFSF